MSATIDDLQSDNHIAELESQLAEVQRYNEHLLRVCIYAMMADAFVTEAAASGAVEIVHALFGGLKVAINSAVADGALNRDWCDHLNLIDIRGSDYCTRCGEAFPQVAIDGGALDGKPNTLDK